MKYLYIILFDVILFLSSCEKIIPDLPRDNPLDGKNDASLVDGVSMAYSNNSVVYDNNNDDIINKGEIVYLKVFLVNNGTSTANSVKATFSISSPYVSLLSPVSQITYGDVSAGSSQYGQFSLTPDYATYYTIKFTVSSTTPTNTQIPININISDANGNTWTGSFNVTVQGISAQIAYSNNTVVYDNNSDGIINKGETVYLKVFLINNGTSTANAVKATFTISSSYVSSLSPVSQITYGDISAGNSQYGQTSLVPDYSTYYTIKFNVSSSTPANTQIPININITDESGNTWTGSFNVTVQSTNAHIAYYSNNIVYDNNSDGIINKGETVYLKVFLINNGTSTANAVKATYTISSSYISQLSPTSQILYGDLSAGNSQYGQFSLTPDYSTYYTIKFTVSNTTPTNTQIPININIADESLNSWSNSFNVTVYQ